MIFHSQSSLSRAVTKRNFKALFFSFGHHVSSTVERDHASDHKILLSKVNNTNQLGVITTSHVVKSKRYRDERTVWLSTESWNWSSAQLWWISTQNIADIQFGVLINQKIQQVPWMNKVLVTKTENCSIPLQLHTEDIWCSPVREIHCKHRIHGVHFLHFQIS